MRVIAGTAKSLPLKTVKGLETRPTTDRIKETLFNMISPYLADCRFLDIFSGSGAIGIEALSRGAALCTFLENNREALRCIRDNLAFTRLEERGKVVGCDVQKGLSVLSGEAPFHIVFMDPPYKSNLEDDLFLELEDLNLVDEDSLIIVEAKLSKSFDFVEKCGFEITKEKRYKTNKHVFLKRSRV